MHWIYAHLIGDYIIQNDWMAQNKKSRSWPCLVHVITYMIPFLFCGLTWMQMTLIAWQHFMIDRTQFVMWFAKIKGSKNFVTTPALFPWSAIILDNILHILWIAFIVWIWKIFEIKI